MPQTRSLFRKAIRSVCRAIMPAIPATRGFAVKALLLRACGYDVDPTARIVSSARIFGTLTLKIGARSFIGHDVLIVGGDSRVAIGADVDIAPRVTIVTGSHEIDMDSPGSAGRGFSSDITIEDGVWIGAGSTLLAGVHIGAKSVIAAGSVVTKDIPTLVMAAGVPCVPKKRWVVASREWESWE